MVMNELTNLEEMLLIAIWRLKGEAYGYRIREFISDIIEKEFTYGNLYSVLGQLVKKEYVTKRTESGGGQRRGRKRVFYAVSNDGIRALRASREVHDTLWDGLTGLVPDES